MLGLCAFLLVRGITHAFIALFAGGSLLHLIQSLSYEALTQAPGGYGGNASYLPILAIFGMLATLVFALGFIALTAFLLGASKSEI